MKNDLSKILLFISVLLMMVGCQVSSPMLVKSIANKSPVVVEKEIRSLPTNLEGIEMLSFFETDTVNIVFYGINHPFFPEDNIGMKTFGYNLSHLSKHFDVAFAFNTGQQLKGTLVELTELGYTLGNICIAGHSGYYGFFVEDGAGFYVNHYVYRKKGKITPFAPGALFIKDIKKAFEQGEIKLATNGVWVLAGCNTSSKNPSFADDMVKITGRSAISANQKVDLFNVPKVGMYLRGTEGGTFYVHEYDSISHTVKKLDINTSFIAIDGAIEAYKKYKPNN